MFLTGEFSTGFALANVGCLLAAALTRRMRRMWAINATEPAVAGPDRPEDVVARLMPESRSIDRAERLLDDYEVALQDRVHLHFIVRREQSSARKSALEEPIEKIKVEVAALRLVIRRELLAQDPGKGES